MSDPSAQPEEPRAVLPYADFDSQVRHDNFVTRWLTYAMIVLIVVGLVALIYGGLPNELHAFVLFGVMVAVSVVVIVSIPRRSTDDTVSWEPPVARRRLREDDRVLDYGRPPERRTARKVARVAGGFGLFIAGGVLGIGSMLGLLALTHDPEISICGPVLAGVVLLFIPSVRTLAAGVVLSPVLAFMIVFAICAGFR